MKHIIDSFDKHYWQIMIDILPETKEFLDAAPTAKRFIFDAATSKYLGPSEAHGEFAITDEDYAFVVKRREFAKPPYPTMYLQMDVGVSYSLDSSVIGFLVHNERVLTMGHNGIAPYIMTLVPTNGLHHSTIFSKPADKEAITKHIAISGFHALKALLLINHHPSVIIERQTRLMPRKGSGYAKTTYKNVRINLSDERSIYHNFLKGTGSPKSPHQVRGHFAHYHLSSDCDHEWSAVEGCEMPRWKCDCGGMRVWKRDFHTGDATAPIKRTYEVFA